MTDTERTAAETLAAVQAIVDRKDAVAKAAADRRRVNQEAARRRAEARAIDAQQERERKSLTKDNAKAKHRPSSRRSIRAKKVAPGRKSTKKKPRKAEARVNTWRTATFNDLVRGLKAPGAEHGAARALFCRYLGERMSDPDIDPKNWLDWIEAECDRLRSELYVNGLMERA